MFGFFRKRPKFDPPLLRFGDDGLTMHQMHLGTFICGGTGSGKTSGALANISRAMMAHESRPGFCFTTAKPGDFERIRGWCSETGRLADLVRFGPGSPTRCDCLNFELSHAQGSAQAAAAMIATIQRVESRQAQGGSGDSKFFEDSAHRFTRGMIEAIWLPKKSISFADCYRFLTSAPNSVEERKSAAWQGESYCWECLRDLWTHAGGSPSSKVTLNAEMWAREWPSISSKTRSVIYTIMASTLDHFLSSEAADLVSSGETNFSPEDIGNGAICVLDMPVLQWREPGRAFQLLFKTLLQRYALRRRVTPGLRPIVLVQDEFQLYANEIDVEVQCVARESGLVNVCLTQSLPTLFDALGGGPKAEQLAYSLIANLQNKVACQSGCHITNEFFSKLLGETVHHMMSGNWNSDDFDMLADACGFEQPNRRNSIGFSSQYRPTVPPATFTQLKKGGSPHYTVEAILFQGGRVFSNGKTHLKVAFSQR